MIVDWIVAFLLLSGGAFAFVAGVGVFRLPDVFMRMHASTKAGTLGCGLVLAAVAVFFGEIDVISRAVAAILFILVTAPIAAHIVGRAAHRTGSPMWDRTHRDDLRIAQEEGRAKRHLKPAKDLND